MSLHFGTHLDAPWHFAENGKRLDDFHIKNLMGSAIVIDLSDKYGPEVAKSKPITIEDLESKFKKANLEIREGDMVIINTGWHKIFSSEPIRYYRDYFTLSTETGAWLASKKVSLVGIDACDMENFSGEIDLVIHKRIYLIVVPLNLGGFYGIFSNSFNRRNRINI